MNAQKIFIGRVEEQMTAGKRWPGYWIVKMEIVQEITDGPTQEAPPPVVWRDTDGEHAERFCDSILFPGLIYDSFRMSAIYEGREEPLTRREWGFLRFFEYCGGCTTQYDALEVCCDNEITKKELPGTFKPRKE